MGLHGPAWTCMCLHGTHEVQTYTECMGLHGLHEMHGLPPTRVVAATRGAWCLDKPFVAADPHMSGLQPPFNP